VIRPEPSAAASQTVLGTTLILVRPIGLATRQWRTRQSRRRRRLACFSCTHGLTPQAGDPIKQMLWHMLLRRLPLNPERHVSLFRNRRNQAVRIPREFEHPGKDAIMRKEGDRLIIEPTQPKSLLAVLSMLKPLDGEFPPIRELDVDPIAI
jgi:antitoxin VapB